MTTIRFERDGAIGNIVLANPPFNRLDLRFAEALRIAVHQASESDIRVLVVRSEGPHFSFGGEVREWAGRDVNWFRTFVADVNVSYRAIEILKIPTVAVVQGVAFGGGFELALACDFLVAAENATFRCVEVTTAMLPIAGALQRIAERAGNRVNHTGKHAQQDARQWRGSAQAKNHGDPEADEERSQPGFAQAFEENKGQRQQHSAPRDDDVIHRQPAL